MDSELASPDGAAISRERRWGTGSFLGQLSDSDRNRFLSLGVTRTYTYPGEVLMRQGDSANHVIAILEGVAKVTASTENGMTVLLGIRTRGDLVGELGAINSSQRTATVVAAGPVRARVIGRHEFLELLTHTPSISFALTQAIAERLRAANARRIDFPSASLETRLARILIELASNHGAPPDSDSGIAISLPLSQAELASMCDASQSSVERLIRKLRNDGILNTGYRRLHIRDLQALRAQAFPAAL